MSLQMWADHARAQGRSLYVKCLLYVAMLVSCLTFAAAQSTKTSASKDDEEEKATPVPKRKLPPADPFFKKTTPRPATEKTQKAGTPAAEKASRSSTPKRTPAGAKPKGDSSATSTAPSKPASTKETSTTPKPTSTPAPKISEATAKTTAAVDPAAPPPEQVPAAPNASLSSSDLVEFASQPPRVQKLIESALALTRRNLTYAYGSADPANGGMDCSGFIHYVLRENGFTDVPRAANEQYVWVRKADEFDAVLSKKKQTFELDALKPGDLLFWTGTYITERDPPVTHSMIYLGTQKGSGRQRVMVGSSDGRTYGGKSRWGVSVFDFQGGQTSRDPSKIGRGGFVGYATIPGIREDAAEAGKSNAR